MTTPPAPDLRNPDVLEALLHAALKAGDVRGVEAALMVMAPIDPRRAERLLGAAKDAVAVANGQLATWTLTAEVTR